MAPGARSKFGAPMFKSEVFRKQMYCIAENTCDIVGTSRRRPQWFCAPLMIRRPLNDSAPGELCPSFPHRYTPDVLTNIDFLHLFQHERMLCLEI